MPLGQETMILLSFLLAFVVTAGVCMLLLFLFRTKDSDSSARLTELRGSAASIVKKGNLAAVWLPKLGEILIPRRQERLKVLRSRMIRAGLYGPRALKLFLGVQFLLLVGIPIVVVAVPIAFNLMKLWQALACGVGGLAISFLLPRMWLEWTGRKRQRLLRRAFPDALDMIVLCCEGGISMIGAIQRVTQELRLAHPVLAGEMNIVEREMQMGRTAGEAVRHLAERCELEEVRHLSSLLLQADLYGASISSSLRISSDELRTKRRQEAEEAAQKASVKILFPMLLCIFPTIFIVLLGPAAIQIATIFSNR